MLRYLRSLVFAFAIVAFPSVTQGASSSEGLMKDVLQMRPSGLNRYRLEIPTDSKFNAQAVHDFILQKVPDIGGYLGRPTDAVISVALTPAVLTSVKEKFPGMQVLDKGEEGAYSTGFIKTSPKHAKAWVNERSETLVIFFPSDAVLEQLEAVRSKEGREAFEKKSLEFAREAIRIARTIGTVHWDERKTHLAGDGYVWKSFAMRVTDLKAMATPKGVAALKHLIKEIAVDDYHHAR